MHRLASSLTRPGPLIPPVPTARACAALTTPLARRRAYATSAPKDAEKASAQSGGSRSKDAVESASTIDDIPSAKGRVGGGPPLESSENPPPRPKIHNSSVPGTGRDKLTKEQQEEVDRHNAEFEKKHDRAAPAADDKVDKNFWSGRGGSRG